MTPLASGDLTLAQAPIESDGARMLIAELDAELHERYPSWPVHGLTPAGGLEKQPTFIVAKIGGEPVGCGALRHLEPGVLEVKRMYVRKPFRRRGISRAILTELESCARQAGATVLRLETGARQPEAIALYLSAGFAEIPPFGEYVGDAFSRCFEKVLR